MTPDDPCLIRECIRIAEPRAGMLDILVLILVAAVVLGALIGYLHWKHDYFARVRATTRRRK